MTDTPSDIARPARRRAAPRRAPPPTRATDTLFKGLDRFGLAPVLLIGLAYIGHTQVVVPIATAYARMVDTVGDTNRLLREAIERNNMEDAERVKEISEAQAENRRLNEENRELNTRILKQLDELRAALKGDR